jgi:16S rRNA (cytidine1402-2'-O)-methyltransferase
LGNPGDASKRLIEALLSARVIAAEDSRKLSRLCKDLGITHTARVISFFEGNESERVVELLEILKSGIDVLVVTDAGMPSVSDPGYRLVRVAIDNEIGVKVLPGPSAVLTALAISGLPTDRFCFEGFAPRTSGARDTWFQKLAEEERTIVFFEAPHRLHESLIAAAGALGSDRDAVICRELTKTYEEIVRGKLDQLIVWASEKEILGEITLVIAGFNPSSREFVPAEIIAKVLAKESAGELRKSAIQAVAQELHLPKREVFDLMVKFKNES